MITIGQCVEVEFMGKLKRGKVVRLGRLDGSTIRTCFVSFDNDPIVNRQFGFRETALKQVEQAT